MGLGPNKSSLLSKLNLKQAWEMSDDELRQLVAADRERRTIQRAIGRMVGLSKDGSTRHSATSGKKIKRAKPKIALTLESLGLAPNLIEGLRKSGKSDQVIIQTLRSKGII